jgi:hypothetical protein
VGINAMPCVDSQDVVLGAYDRRRERKINVQPVLQALERLHVHQVLHPMSQD